MLILYGVANVVSMPYKALYRKLDSLLVGRANPYPPMLFGGAGDYLHINMAWALHPLLIVQSFTMHVVTLGQAAVLGSQPMYHFNK